MTTKVEVFATGAADPQSVWAVVGDLRRLPEWTDADEVEAAGSVRPGTQFVTVDAGRRLRWRVVTSEPGLLEAVTELPKGRIGIGARVAADAAGARVVLAGVIDRSGSAVRTALFDAPALRRRFDRWSLAALGAARRGEPRG